jgi:hypothetical protein
MSFKLMKTYVLILKKILSVLHPGAGAKRSRENEKYIHAMYRGLGNIISTGEK